MFAVVARLHGGKALAMHDDLRADLGFGFQQDGVHIDNRLKPAGQGLQCLCAANFTAVCGDRGVVGHVLGLERGDG